MCILFCITGQEYAAIVEFAPFQKAAKKKSKKKDAKTGTIDDGITARVVCLYVFISISLYMRQNHLTAKM